MLDWEGGKWDIYSITLISFKIEIRDHVYNKMRVRAYYPIAKYPHN